MAIKVEIVLTLISKDFSSEFYQAYNAVLPLELEFDERVDLYCLIWYLSPGYYAPHPDDLELIIRFVDLTEKYGLAF